VNHDNAKQGGTRKVPCQICTKTGHEARDCWYHYDDDDKYQHKTVGAAVAGYGIDTNWYADSGASDHITSELEKMAVRDKYSGQDQVHTASGPGMKISNTFIQFCIPQIEDYILKIFCMCQAHPKACCLFIVLLMIMMPSLSFI
jgi:hypothetical protein